MYTIKKEKIMQANSYYNERNKKINVLLKKELTNLPAFAILH